MSEKFTKNKGHESVLVSRDEWMNSLSQESTAPNDPVVMVEYVDQLPSGEGREASEIASVLKRQYQNFDPNDSSQVENRKKLRSSGREFHLSYPMKITEADSIELISDNVIKEFLSERSNALSEYANEIRDLLPELHRILVDGFEEGRKLGYIPNKLSEDRLSDILRRSVVIAMDNYLMPRGTKGAYKRLDDRVEVANSKTSPGNKDVLVHEQTHRLSGGTFKKNLETGEVVRSRVGFVEVLGSKKRHMRLNEATTEHIAQSILYGKWDVMNPYRRREEHGFAFGGYGTERFGLGLLVHRSAGKMNLQTLARAFFEDTNEGGTDSSSARRKMISEMHESYRIGTFHRLNEMMELVVSKVADKTKQIEIMKEVIKAPEVASDGSIANKGFIDMKLLGVLLTDNNGIIRGNNE